MLSRVCLLQASKTYLRKLITALHFAWQQAAGRPSGPHAAFKDVMVDAATVRLTRKVITCALYMHAYEIKCHVSFLLFVVSANIILQAQVHAEI